MNNAYTLAEQRLPPTRSCDGSVVRDFVRFEKSARNEFVEPAAADAGGDDTVKDHALRVSFR